MRKFLLAAVAAAAIASPAAARDGTGYVGADLGAMLAEDTKLDFDNDTLFINNAVAVDYGLGFDIGLVGGYDFGMVRAEFDLGYKHAGANEVVLGQGVCTTAQNCVLDADGDASVLSAMANVILDFGDENGITGFIGLGAGMARVGIDTDFSGTFPNTPVTGFGVDDDDTALAGQIIARQREYGCRSEVSLLQHAEAEVLRRHRPSGRPLALAQPAGVADLQLLLASAAASAAAPAASAASRDADVPGRIGDPGDRRLPGSAASASAAAAGARARLSERAQENSRSGATRAGFFYAFEFRSASRATGTAGRARRIRDYRAAATGLT